MLYLGILAVWIRVKRHLIMINLSKRSAVEILSTQRDLFVYFNNLITTSHIPWGLVYKILPSATYLPICIP